MSVKVECLYYKLVLVILILLMCFTCTNVLANAAGGGGAGGGALQGSCNGTFCGGFEITYESGSLGSAYKVQLVYYPGSGSTWEILGNEVIIYSGTNSQVINKIKTRSEKYLNDGTAREFAQKLHDIVYNNGSDDAVTNWFNANNSENFKKLASEMGVKSTELRKKSTKERAFNSAGYRFIAQKLVAFDGGFQSRKEFASNNSVNAGANCLNGIWYVTNGSCVGTFRDLYTRFDDIGIRAPGLVQDYLGRNISYWGYDRLKKRIENSSDPSGSGYGIYEFENPYEKQYDYRPDSLCYNCDDADEDWSYVYTDMANWKGIGESLDSDNNKVKNYFKNGTISGNDVACREQIKVKFPDSDNAIRVETGRYFTVGLPGQYSMGTPNFAPLTVERTKECHAYNSNGDDVTGSISDSQWNNFWSSDKFYKNKDTGKITLTYKETGGSKKYNGSKDTDTYNTRVNRNKGNLTITNSYTLTANTFRYIRKDNGLSVSTKPNGIGYIDVGVANFPISFDNLNDGGQAASISFKYTMPTDSHLNKTIGNSNYFGDNSQSAEEDIYKVASKNNAIGNNYVTQGGLDADQFNDLKHTSCVLEYCDVNGQNCKSGFNACMNSKVKSGKTQKKCSSDNYVCNIINFEENETKCKYENGKYYYNDVEISRNEYFNVYHCDNGIPDTDPCEKKEGKYYYNNVEISRDEYFNKYYCDYDTEKSLCKIANGKYYYNNVEISRDEYVNKYHCDAENEYVCRQVGNKYYIDGKEISKSEYLQKCPCSTSNGKYYINMVEVSKSDYQAVCPPTEKECPDDDPCCYDLCPPVLCPPGETCDGINVIYRTIDLNNPFPGYRDEKRKTGSNWCTYDVANKKLKCDGYKNGDNDVVKEVIFNNRGTKTNPEYAYNEEPIYELELDSAKIQEIRDYNSDNEYSDFTLNCNDDGTGCKLSSKVKNLLGLKGTCVNARGTNFYTCDE